MLPYSTPFRPSAISVGSNNTFITSGSAFTIPITVHTLPASLIRTDNAGIGISTIRGHTSSRLVGTVTPGFAFVRLQTSFFHIGTLLCVILPLRDTFQADLTISSTGTLLAFFRSWNTLATFGDTPSLCFTNIRQLAIGAGADSTPVFPDSTAAQGFAGH